MGAVISEANVCQSLILLQSVFSDVCVRVIHLDISFNHLDHFIIISL